MIYIFRKEMKKWHTLLGLVLASFVIGGLSSLFLSPQSWRDVKVAKVNGNLIYFDQYRRSLLDVQSRLSSLRPLAQMYGMSEEMLMSMFLGVNSPEEFALDTCVKEKLLDGIKDKFSVTLDHTWLKNELLKSLKQLTDKDGRLNMDMYQQYLSRMSMTPAQYEENQANELKRAVINRLVDATIYVPKFITKDLAETESIEKKFSVLKIPLATFADMVKKETPDEASLERFYQEQKEKYRLPEKFKATYWLLDPKTYSKKIDLSDATIKDFYEKHKATLYRIPPKIKVRHIFIKAGTDKAESVIHDLHKKIVAKPDEFGQLAQKNSNDEKTAKNGGLTDLFTRGTYDEDFERAAFRLKTNGEVSPVTKTKGGFEIIQLVNRINATEKPFDAVKDDIAKTLTDKRSINAVRADVETLMRTARENSEAIEKFAQEHALQNKTTQWLTESGKETSLEGMLAQKIFASRKQQNSNGYFIHDNMYVIYRVIEVAKSSLPTIDQIKGKMLEDYYADKSEKIAKNSMKEARLDVLSKKMTLDKLAEKYNGAVSTKEGTKKSIKIDGDDATKDKMFSLSDPAQILEYFNNDTFYLVQLIDSKPVNLSENSQDYSKIIKQEKYKFKNHQLAAFIASLHKNAKIDYYQDKKALENTSTELKD